MTHFYVPLPFTVDDFPALTERHAVVRHMSVMAPIERASGAVEMEGWSKSWRQCLSFFRRATFSTIRSASDSAFPDRQVIRFWRRVTALLQIYVSRDFPSAVAGMLLAVHRRLGWSLAVENLALTVAA